MASARSRTRSAALRRILARSIGRHLTPELEALLGSGERLVEVGLGGVAELAQHAVLGRVDDILGLAAGGLGHLPSM